MLDCAILCGGLASRLRPLTERIPKSLLVVAEKPFIVHQLELLRSQGVTRVVLCVGHLGHQIREFVGDGSLFEMNVSYSSDGEHPLGTAGAIRKALSMLGPSFFVLYGDSYLPCDFEAVATAFAAARLPALMTIYENAGKYDSSNVEVQNGRIFRYDKKVRSRGMRYIDYGLGVFARSVFEKISEGQTCDLADVYRQLVSVGELAAFEVSQRFYEIGSLSGIADLEQHLLKV